MTHGIALRRSSGQDQIIRWMQGLEPTIRATAQRDGGSHRMAGRIALTHHGMHGEARTVGIWPVSAEDGADVLGTIAEDVYRMACEDAQAYDGPQRYAANLYVGSEPTPTVRRAFRVASNAEVDGLMPSEPASPIGFAAMTMRHAEAMTRQLVLQQEATTNATMRMCHEVGELMAQERARRSEDDARRDREVGRLLDQVDRWMVRFFESADAREEALSKQQERELERARWEAERRFADDERALARQRESLAELRKNAAYQMLFDIAPPLVTAILTKNDQAVAMQASRALATMGHPEAAAAAAAIALRAEPTGQPEGAPNADRPDSTPTSSPPHAERSQADSPPASAPPPAPDTASPPEPKPLELSDNPMIRAQVRQILQMLGASENLVVAIHEVAQQLPRELVPVLMECTFERATREGYFPNEGTDGDEAKQPG